MIDGRNELAPLDCLRTWSPLIALASLALCGLGAWLDPLQFARSYLFAWFLPLGISLGSLALLMLHNLTGGAWGRILHRNLTAASGMIPLVGLLFLPLAVNLPALYPWADNDVVAHNPVLAEKQPYLNAPFFWARAAGYFAVWIALALVFNRRRDRPVNQAISGLGLLTYVLTITFASIDWGMSLNPEWFSSIYGPMFMIGQGLSALAFAIVGLIWLSPRTETIEAMVDTLRDLGNLLLAFIMLWAYMSFSQFLIIWMGNLPEDASWYEARDAGGWQICAVCLALLHFAVPFVVLLSRDVKQNPGLLAGVAAWMLLMRLVDLYWLVMPAFHPERLVVHWLDFVLPLALGGLWLTVLAWRFHRLPAQPWATAREGLSHG